MTTPFSSSQGLDTLLPTKYLELKDVFKKSKASTILYYHTYDCPMHLQPGKEPPWGTIYNLSPSKLKFLREYVDEKLANGFIRHSKSPTSAPIFLVKNKDGSL